MLAVEDPFIAVIVVFTVPAQIKTRAYILSASDYRETSSLLQVFSSEEGRISLVARGLKGAGHKKKSGAPEPFSLVQITCSLREGANLGILGTIETEHVCVVVRENLHAYAIASYWFEIIGAVAPSRTCCQRLFGLTETFISCLESAAPLSAPVLWHFGRLLAETGFGVELDRCAGCDANMSEGHFDFEECSPLCARCARTGKQYFPLPFDAMRAIIPLLTADMPCAGRSELTPRHIMIFLHLLNELFSRNLDQRMKSFSFLLSTLGQE
ncbi:MAG: DNA repair protein RecO [Candidatus Sumerlaeota bacterium]|nr:DNA repair protein RecO [Candidatus Sumerlaeota bacterium]